MNSRISIKPEVHSGKPCVAGTRIPVYAVLELVEKGVPFPDIIKNYYPDLSQEDIQACVHYAVDIVNSEQVFMVAEGQ